jgi:hypothetical protein
MGIFMAKTFTEDAANARDTDRHTRAANYLTSMSKALADDAVKVLARDRVSESTAKKGDRLKKVKKKGDEKRGQIYFLLFNSFQLERQIGTTDHLRRHR